MEQARVLLAKLSSVEGSSKTIEWLKNTVGDGTDFTVLVAEIFVGSNESVDILFKEASALPKSAKVLVNQVLFQKLINSDEPAKKIQFAFSSGDPDSLNEGMTLALKLMMMQSNATDETKNSMKSIMKELEGDCLIKFRNAYLTGLSIVSPKDAWKEMQMLGEGNLDASSWQSSLREKISAQLRAQGPSDSLEFLVREGGSASEVRKSVSMWGNMNPVELNKWVSEQMGKLSSSQMDGVYTGLADLSLQKGDFSDVQKQLVGISDIKLKSDIERRLWEGQRDAIKRDILKDPNGTLMSIVSGSSQYADYWIEEAMGTWVAKDFDKAQTWYQENWQKLPASKGQYLAAAFANQAASQGDTETARQWATHIKDPKTKQRIEAGIAKAEAAKNN